MTTETPIVLNAIEPVLRTQRKGVMLTDLSAAMQQAVAATREHLKESVITLTLRGGTGQQAGEMELPSMLNLNVVPFEGSALMSVTARLRYKINERKIILFYKLVNPHLVVRQVANDVVNLILSKTGIEPFMV